MVLQRLQTLWLLVAAIALAALTYAFPIVCTGTACAYGYTTWPTTVIGSVTLIMVLIDIFLYHNLKWQITVAWINIILEFATGIVFGIVMVRIGAGAQILWAWPAVCLVVAVVFTFWALRGMLSDQRKLKSYDRLR